MDPMQASKESQQEYQQPQYNTLEVVVQTNQDVKEDAETIQLANRISVQVGQIPKEQDINEQIKSELITSNGQDELNNIDSSSLGNRNKVENSSDSSADRIDNCESQRSALSSSSFGDINLDDPDEVLDEQQDINLNSNPFQLKQKKQIEESSELRIIPQVIITNESNDLETRIEEGIFNKTELKSGMNPSENEGSEVESNEIIEGNNNLPSNDSLKSKDNEGINRIKTVSSSSGESGCCDYDIDICSFSSKTPSNSSEGRNSVIILKTAQNQQSHQSQFSQFKQETLNDKKDCLSLKSGSGSDNFTCSSPEIIQSEMLQNKQPAAVAVVVTSSSSRSQLSGAVMEMNFTGSNSNSVSSANCSSSNSNTSSKTSSPDSQRKQKQQSESEIIYSLPFSFKDSKPESEIEDGTDTDGGHVILSHKTPIDFLEMHLQSQAEKKRLKNNSAKRQPPNSSGPSHHNRIDYYLVDDAKLKNTNEQPLVLSPLSTLQSRQNQQLLSLNQKEQQNEQIDYQTDSQSEDVVIVIKDNSPDESPRKIFQNSSESQFFSNTNKGQSDDQKERTFQADSSDSKLLLSQDKGIPTPKSQLENQEQQQRNMVQTIDVSPFCVNPMQQSDFQNHLNQLSNMNLSLNKIDSSQINDSLARIQGASSSQQIHAKHSGKEHSINDSNQVFGSSSYAIEDASTQQSSRIKYDANSRGNTSESIDTKDLKSNNTLFEKDKDNSNSFETFHLSFCSTCLLLANCIIYGYLIPRRQSFIEANTEQTFKIIISAFIILETAWKILGSLKLRIFHPIIIFQLILSLANIFCASSNIFVEYGFFLRFLTAIWDCQFFSRRMLTFTTVLKSAVKPKVEILIFMVIFSLIFKVTSYVVFNLNSSFSDPVEVINTYVISHFDQQQQDHNPNTHHVYERNNTSNRTIDFELFAAFILLFIIKLIPESLLVVIDKVSLEQLSEYASISQYSCKSLAIFKHNSCMRWLFNKKRLFTFIQAIFVLALCFSQLPIPFGFLLDASYNPFSLLLFARVLGVIIVSYEISIDVTLQSSLNLIKNILFVCSILFPASAYVLLGVAGCYSCMRQLSIFKQIDSLVEAVAIDFFIIIIVNVSLLTAYDRIHGFFGGLIQLLITLPLLKGIMLRYSELFEIKSTEEDHRSLEVLAEIQLSNYKSRFHDTDLEYQCNEEISTALNSRGTLFSSAVTPSSRQSSHNLIPTTKYQTKHNNSCLNDNSYFIFSNSNPLRKACKYLSNSTVFTLLTTTIFALTAFKELILSANPNIYEDIKFYAKQWDRYIDPSCLIIFNCVHTISAGLLFNRRSYLRRSLINVAQFFILILYAVQPIVFDKNKIMSLRILYLLQLIPLFKSMKFKALINAISLSKRVIFQIIVTAVLLTSIIKLLSLNNSNAWVDISNRIVLIFGVNLLVSVILVEFSKNQTVALSKQHPNQVWTSIKSKVRKYELNFYYLKQQSRTQSRSQTGVTLARCLVNQYASSFLTFFLICYYSILCAIAYYLQLFHASLSVETLNNLPIIKRSLISAFSYSIILYTFLCIKVFNILPFFMSSRSNKILILQSVFLASLLFLEVLLSGFVDYSTPIQFLLQLPILLRINLIQAIIKFGKCIGRQIILSLISASILSVIAVTLTGSTFQETVFSYLLISFNVNPATILYTNENQIFPKQILLIAISLLVNGVIHSVLFIDLIHKFEYSESKQAKNFYKRIVFTFESLWDIRKSQQNPCLMHSSLLLEFLVTFDQAIISSNPNIAESIKPKVALSRIEQLKRIHLMKIKIDDSGCLYYKDLLFKLVSEKLNLNHHKGTNCNSQAEDFQVEDFELTSLPETRRWKVYSPIKSHFLMSMVFRSWMNFSFQSNQKEQTLTIQQSQKEVAYNQEGEQQGELVEEEEESIFSNKNVLQGDVVSQQTPLISHFHSL